MQNGLAPSDTADLIDQAGVNWETVTTVEEESIDPISRADPVYLHYLI